MTAAFPSPEAFRDECRAFLEARYPRRADVAQPFRWGEGSDAVGLFEEADPSEEAAQLTAVKEWRRALWDAGLAWISGPAAFGGRELPGPYQQIFDREARGFEVAGNGMLTISLGMIAPTIVAHGTAGAKDRYLAALQRADLVACQLFSEPGAGSDLASVSTRARRDGDGWRITGQKVWTSGAQYSDIGEVLCRTSDDGRHRNLTAFVLDMRAPGVEVRPLRQMTGGAAFNEVFFDDAWVPDDDRLGEVGGGWRVAITTLSNERAAIGGDGFGGAGLLNFDRYRQMAEVFGKGDDPVVRQRLADLLVHQRVANYTRRRAADARRAGHAPGPEASIGKLALAQQFQRIGDFVGLVLGPKLVADTGEWGTYAWAGLLQSTPGYRIGGGTDEVMRNIVAERVLGLPKEPGAAGR
ncbi:MAG: acyl-CoA dehydrogenase [Acidimicrobiia bacterium]|nr:acyl-CoA dehydrogenase [Acidimicrobiia bacterium]